MPDILSTAADQPVADDLISLLLKAIPDGRYWRGVCYPQRLRLRLLLLVAVLGIL